MKINNKLEGIDYSFAKNINKISGQNVYLCYQCKKCTSGCPTFSFMDFSPTNLMRYIQLGLKDKIFKENAIWFCVSCHTCTTRCPQDIDIAHIFDTLKIIAKKEHIKINNKSILIFNMVWMTIIKYFGRIYEPGLIAIFNILNNNPLQNFDLAFKLIKNRKIKLFPSIIGTFKMMKIFLNAKRLK